MAGAMGQGYECDRCGGLNSGKPHTRIILGDGIPRHRPRGHPREVEEGDELHDRGTAYDVCPGCRSEFESWWDE